LRVTEQAIEEARAALAELGERLRGLNRERAVGRHERHALGAELALLRRQCRVAEEQLHSYAPNYLAQQDALRKLATKARQLNEAIEEAEQENAAVTAQLSVTETEIETGRLKLAELEDEKHKVVEEIAWRLKKTTLDRDAIEKQLNEVALEFRDVVAARDETFQIFTENQQVRDALAEDVAVLERRVDELERMRALDAERKTLAEQVQAKARDVGLVLEAMNSAERQLASMKARVQGIQATAAENERQLAALEREIGAYRQARGAAQARKEALDASAAALTAFDESLGELLAGAPSLEEEVHVLTQQLARVADALEPLAAV